ncbi:MAG TPA: thioesterase family protein [Verrucomicrobiota bacterium]|nr:thioesterase family protein [Verrucomicrobiota bacterium]
MKENPKIGLTGKVEFVVGNDDVIKFDTNKMPSVLSTPMMINYLEQAARLAIEPLLEPEESSVGIEIEVQHLAPTPIGQKVVCLAKVIYVDGNLITYHIEASDQNELIARGTHKRAVINAQRFKRRVEKKNI